MGRTLGDARRFTTFAFASLLWITAHSAFAQDALRSLQVPPQVQPGAPAPLATPFVDDAPLIEGSLPPQFDSHESFAARPCYEMCGRGAIARWPAGIEVTFLRPDVPNNRGFSSNSSDRNSDFEYDVEAAPRLWWGYEKCDGLGWRITWWNFDHDPDRVYAQPEGGETVSIRPFDGIDISSDDTTDNLLAASSLKVSTFDFEITKRVSDDCSWAQLSAGLRYATAEQSYLAQFGNDVGVLQSQLNFDHWIRGIGPTISATMSQYVSGQTYLFARGRGSLLFGNHKWHLHGSEDLTVTTPEFFNADGRNGETLSIIEAQVGVGWQGDKHFCNPWQPFATLAIEGQLWTGPGAAAKPDGDLRFIGGTMGAGWRW